ncbi:uncharacterized protein LY89DRAFT_781965 [Mollisia scopiformis]|uniref:Uncharacterized protein n=1 Tax=Mollisia scopiformis TaxID=149040 RepID=A0A194X970_MOLSC|nr:uncharacterized protein LY89DRAFT_781965 [Mollisia scopiformis]KUJ16669.1 hypothetical protein LY89DRAFT_781965 [Mollisia scopiformis]
MSVCHQSHIDRCEELVGKLEQILHDVNGTHDTHDVQPEGLRLEDDMKRWTEALKIHIDAIRQKGEVSQHNDSSGADTIFSVLSNGMDDTIDLIRDTATLPSLQQTTRMLSDLRMRVALHTESTTLITDHLDRWSFRYTPNAQMELSKMVTAYFNQKANLEARLKDAFRCNSFALLANHKSTSQDKCGGLDFSPGNVLVVPDSKSGRYLESLKAEAAVSLPDFREDTAMETVLRVSIYLLDVLYISLHGTRAGAAHEIKTSKLHGDLYKCAWIVHNLINYYASRTTNAENFEVNQIVEMVLEKLTRAFVTYDKIARASVDFEPDSLDLSIRDPFASSISRKKKVLSLVINTLPKVDSRLLDFAEPKDGPAFTSSPYSSPHAFSRGKGQASLFQADAAPHSVGIDEPFELLTASFDAEQSLENQKWIPSTIRITPELSVVAKFRVRICQENSLIREIVVNAERAEVVPNYCFRKTPAVLSFREGSQSSSILFSTKSEIADLTDLTSCFVEDQFESYFPSINEVFFQGRKLSSSIKLLSPTAQVWTVADPGRRFYPVHAHCSQPIVSLQQKDAIEAIADQVEVSRILFFGGSSIFSVLVTDQTQLTRSGANSVTVSCNSRAGSSLPITIKKGTDARPAGIPMTSSARARDKTAESKEFSSISIMFPGPKGADEFEEAYQRCNERWLSKAARLKAQRNLRRDPIIRSKSHFH